MLLVEGFAIVGVLADADLVAAPEPDLAEPVGIGKRLAGEADDVRLPAGENSLGLGEAVDAAGDDDRRGESAVADRFPDATGRVRLRPKGPRASEMNCGMHS